MRVKNSDKYGSSTVGEQRRVYARLLTRIAQATRENGGDEKMAEYYDAKAKRTDALAKSQ